jgi:hypothetical protein
MESQRKAGILADWVEPLRWWVKMALQETRIFEQVEMWAVG